VVAIEKFGDGRMEEFKSNGNGVAGEIPLIVLVNEGSASASEIVAGAIQDRGRGRLVGVTTFGKGSVQTFAPLVNEQGAIRVTIARWLTPNERTIQGIGLTPDFEVPLSPEDLEAGNDRQLAKAVELLNGTAP
jgi:carboxyl-terminal processing protease